MSVTFDEHVRAFLNKPLAAVLATVSPRGRPQATPVWFMLEDGLTLYRYVQIRGEAVRFDPHNGARDIDRLSMRYTGKPYPYPGGQRPEDRVSVLIKPRSVSGWRG